MRNVLLGHFVLLAILLILPGPAGAEVTDSSEGGFLIQIEVPIEAPPQEVYARLIDIGKWWESSHTYSGSAENLYLEASEKGWFGERLPEGGIVQHMEVVFAAPGKTLRLRGALGPLQEYAITGSMTWTLTPKDKATSLKLTYYVAGYRPGGVADFAKPVDYVLSTQVNRLKRLMETGDPKS